MMCGQLRTKVSCFSCISPSLYRPHLIGQQNVGRGEVVEGVWEGANDQDLGEELNEARLCIDTTKDT